MRSSRVGHVADAARRPAEGVADAHVSGGEQNRLAGRPARLGGGAIEGRRPPQPSRWAEKTPTSCAASMHSSDPVGRGLTSTTQARSPSHTRSTPNSPRSSNADARCAHIARAATASARSLHLAEPRRHEVSAPRVSARAEPAVPDQLLAHAEQDGRAPVGDGRGRAREPRDVLLHHHLAVQRPAAPLANAPSAAAAHRLAQPAAGALGASRCVGGAERRRVGEAGRAQGGAERRRVAHPLERLARAPEQPPAGCQPGDEVRPVLESRPVDHARRRNLLRRVHQRRHPAATAEVAQHGDARAKPLQVEIAEAVERHDVVPRPHSQLGQHARADGDHEDRLARVVRARPPAAPRTARR